MTARAVIAGLLFALIAAAPSYAQDAEEADAPLPANTSVLDRQIRLDRLLDKLAQAPDAEEAKRYEASIDVIWGKSGSDTADLLTARASEMVADDKKDDALRLLDAALEAKPDFAEGWNLRATLFFLNGDYASAMSAIYETLRYEPRHYGAWAGLGRILQQTGDDRKALQAYRRALAIHPHLEGLKKEVDELEIKLRGEEL
jgi:tetratricopeptide (TPR) repeat protein